MPQQQGFQNLDPKTAKMMNFIMDKNLALMTKVVMRVYADADLQRDYKALRDVYDIDDWKGKSSQREIIRYPHPYVAKFIDAEMTKKYGPLWSQDKSEFRRICKKENLIRPWLIVPPDKI